jgi:hypothetical protein
MFHPDFRVKKLIFQAPDINHHRIGDDKEFALPIERHSESRPASGRDEESHLMLMATRTRGDSSPRIDRLRRVVTGFRMTMVAARPLTAKAAAPEKRR